MAESIRGLQEFNRFLGKQPHAHKLFVTGNHDVLDLMIQQIPVEEIVTNAICLENAGLEVEGIKIFGISRNPKLSKDMILALNRKNPRIRGIIDIIPNDIDILLSHDPPVGILDQKSGKSVGSSRILEIVQKIKPKYHVFGHAHGANGMRIQHIDNLTIRHINASILTETLGVLDRPRVFEI